MTTQWEVYKALASYPNKTADIHQIKEKLGPSHRYAVISESLSKMMRKWGYVAKKKIRVKNEETGGNKTIVYWTIIADMEEPKRYE